VTYPYASTDTAVTGFVTAQNSGGTRGSGAQFAPAIINNGIAGATTDNAIGFSSLSANGTSTIAMGNGFNTVIIDGAGSPGVAASGSPDAFSFTVDSTGLVTLTDTTTGHSQAISGVSYLIFDGAALGTNAQYQQIYFIGNANQTEVTELYNAAFGRQPDLGGVEYYANQLNSGYSFQQIATEFMASPEFQARYGANVSDTQFVTNLYQNVLHRAASSTELAYYTSALANYEAGSIVNTTNPVAWSRAQELLNFTNSPENQADVSGFVINTAGTATNGLVYTTPAQASESAAAVLAQAEATGNLDTTLINPASVTGEISNSTGTVDIDPPGGLVSGISVNTTQTTGIFTLSPGVPDFGDGGLQANSATYTVNGSSAGGSYIYSAAGTVNLHGTGNIINQEGSGPQPYSPTPIITVTGFTAGDFLITSTTSGGQGTYTLLTPSASNPLHGSTLSAFGFGSANTNEYFVNVGSVGSGSAAEVAAAANKVYVPSSSFLEQIVFFGQITSGANAGGTAVFDWADITGAPSSADSNGNHQVDANEFTGGTILVGVPSTSISTATFFHK